VSPEDAGIALSKPDDLKGGDPDHNAKALKAVLNGEPGPYRDVVLYNSAAALLIAEKADDLKDGAAQAASAIDDGKALKTLDHLITITNL
jgi:anthranilate phosphoribosyltransferase